MALDLSQIPEEIAAPSERPERVPWQKKRLKRKKQCFFTLKCAPEIIPQLADVLKDEISKRVKNTLKWDVARCPDYETFIKRYMGRHKEELNILLKLITNEELQDFMNTFIPYFDEAKEQYVSARNNPTRPRNIERPM